MVSTCAFVKQSLLLLGQIKQSKSGLTTTNISLNLNSVKNLLMKRHRMAREVSRNPMNLCQLLSIQVDSKWLLDSTKRSRWWMFSKMVWKSTNLSKSKHAVTYSSQMEANCLLAKTRVSSVFLNFSLLKTQLITCSKHILVQFVRFHGLMMIQVSLVVVGTWLSTYGN